MTPTMSTRITPASNQPASKEPSGACWYRQHRHTGGYFNFEATANRPPDPEEWDFLPHGLSVVLRAEVYCPGSPKGGQGTNEFLLTAGYGHPSVCDLGTWGQEATP